jgi:hypothetical protein
MPTLLNDGAVYLDIKSTWFSIMRVVGWDVDYYPLKWLGAGTPPLDFPWKDNKIARSALVSVAQSLTIPMYDPKKHKIIQRPTYNKFLNWGVYAIIAHVLSAIAYEAIHAGAVYVNTDGFIVADDKAERVAAVLDSWGLDYSAKAHGTGFVMGPGCYKVGPKKSKLIIKATPILNVYVPGRNIGWLKDRFTRLNLLSK